MTCKYCSGNGTTLIEMTPNLFKDNTRVKVNIRVPLVKVRVFKMNDDQDNSGITSNETVIRFCPMCGRNLHVDSRYQPQHEDSQLNMFDEDWSKDNEKNLSK